MPVRNQDLLEVLRSGRSLDRDSIYGCPICVEDDPRALPTTVSWRGCPAPPPATATPTSASPHAQAARGYVDHMAEVHGVSTLRRRHLPMCIYSPLAVSVLMTRIRGNIEVRNLTHHSQFNY